ncbi:hypothetical protein HAX54_000406 [Datura stramonium]|uniref:Uncharacterized protein n=1 Tax=Datura stramonium TaxID=4076 RepID=A0ABS8T0Z4_DATST|nr:hypothetical protein [Datura stramonium]
MSTKLEQASSRIQTAASSATSLSGPKISMFANKTGFVIPKQLAGAKENQVGPDLHTGYYCQKSKSLVSGATKVILLPYKFWAESCGSNNTTAEF